MVVVQFEITPKALANLSPGFEEREPWGRKQKYLLTLKGFANRLTLSGLFVCLCWDPRVVASSNPGLKLANAFGVFSN